MQLSGNVRWGISNIGRWPRRSSQCVYPAGATFGFALLPLYPLRFSWHLGTGNSGDGPLPVTERVME